MVAQRSLQGGPGGWGPHGSRPRHPRGQVKGRFGGLYLGQENPDGMTCLVRPRALQNLRIKKRWPGLPSYHSDVGSGHSPRGLRGRIRGSTVLLGRSPRLRTVPCGVPGVGLGSKKHSPNWGPRGRFLLWAMKLTLRPRAFAPATPS